MPVDSTINALKKLQGALRVSSRAKELATPAMTITIPDDLASAGFRTVLLDRDEVGLLKETQRQVSGDLRFEYLKDRELKKALRRFVCTACIERRIDHVEGFITKFAREPVELRCYFPLLYLTVTEPYELEDVLFLPIGDERVPVASFFDTAPPCGGVVSVMAKGTNSKLMRSRARSQVEHALRILRVAFRGLPYFHGGQLRFHLGETFAFDGGRAGWQLREDAPLGVNLTQEVKSLIQDQPLGYLPYQTTTDVEAKAKLALKWVNRAYLVTDRVEAMLYLFFALEGLLGDRSEGLKAYGLVFRRAILQHAMTGYFSDPLRIYYLYEEVRSAVVHGSEAPEVSKKELSLFARNMRYALNEFLAFAGERGLTKRSKVVSALIDHEDAPQILEWLRQRDPRWRNFKPFQGGVP